MSDCKLAYLHGQTKQIIHLAIADGRQVYNLIEPLADAAVAKKYGHRPSGGRGMTVFSASASMPQTPAFAIGAEDDREKRAKHHDEPDAHHAHHAGKDNPVKMLRDPFHLTLPQITAVQHDRL